MLPALQPRLVQSRPHVGMVSRALNILIELGHGELIRFIPVAIATSSLATSWFFMMRPARIQKTTKMFTHDLTG